MLEMRNPLLPGLREFYLSSKDSLIYYFGNRPRAHELSRIVAVTTCRGMLVNNLSITF